MAAAAADNHSVTVWDVTTHTLRYPPIHASGGFLPGLAFGPDGSTLVTSGWAGLELWAAATGADLGGLIGARPWSDLSLSADGSLAAFASEDAEIWDLRRGSFVTAVGGDAEADEFSVALSPDGRTLAVGGYGRFVRLWDVQNGELLHELDQGGTRPISLEFSPDGRSIVTAGTMWDVASGTRIGPNLAPGLLTSMTDLSSDGRSLVVTDPDGHGAVWDLDPASLVRRACALA